MYVLCGVYEWRMIAKHARNIDCNHSICVIIEQQCDVSFDRIVDPNIIDRILMQFSLNI